MSLSFKPLETFRQLQDFFTPIHFCIEPPQEGSGLHDARLIVSYPKRWILEHASSYLNPFHTSIFYIESYHKEQGCFIGRRIEKKQSSFWSSTLKVISFATLILPTLAVIALWITRCKLICREKSVYTAQFYHCLQSVQLRFRAREQRIKHTKQIALAHALNERFVRGIQKGGDISLSNGEIAWVSFKSDQKNISTQYVYIKLPSARQGIKELFESRIASAKLSFTSDRQTLQISDFYVNKAHRWIHASQAADPSLGNYPCDAVIETATHILGAAARCLASLPSIDKKASIEVLGDLAGILTLDGPLRQVDESYVISRLNNDDPLTASDHLKIPLHTLIRGARDQIYLPKHTKELMVGSSSSTAESEVTL